MKYLLGKESHMAEHIEGEIRLSPRTELDVSSKPFFLAKKERERERGEKKAGM